MLSRHGHLKGLERNQQYVQFIYLAHYLRKSKLISIKELAYTLRHICWDLSAFPDLLSGLQDGTDT